MEQKTVSYTKGITRSPSDMLCQDGELAECVNLEVRGEELVPMEMPKHFLSLSSGETLLLVHNISSGRKNYIVRSGSYVRAFYLSGGSRIDYSISTSISGIKSIQSIGNTIIIYTSDSPHYILYKDGAYKYLGTGMPEVGLSFNLYGTMVVTETFDVNVPSLGKNATEGHELDPDLTSEDNQKSVTNQILPQVNKFIAEESEAKGKFIYPFLVRYAYRLFDGTCTRHSSPVLLVPSTDMAPVCGYMARQDARPPFKTFIAAVPSTLTFRVESNSNLSDWSDIISEVVIYVSAPIRTYDQNGTIQSKSYNVYTNFAPSNTTAFYGSMNGGGFKKSLIGENFSKSSNDPGSFVWWDLPARDKADIQKEVAECSLFYKYASFSPSFIDSNFRVSIDPSSAGVNPTAEIEAGELMNDDYMTHDTLVPESSFVYNRRLNISNIKRKLFKGYSSSVLAQLGTNDSVNGFYSVYTYIRTKSGTVVVKSMSPQQSGQLYGMYFFYPDTDAFQMVIHDTYNNRYATVPLVEHPRLNGAYYASVFSELPFNAGSPGVSESSEQYEYFPNKLYTSEVNNPFLFPLEGINTVGSGDIIGMSAVTVPISQGQFGQYPLLVFCSDGNFALKVDEQGYYSGISPVQEDTVLGGDKITPLENSVVIITKKGLMLATGGEMTLLAGSMDGANFVASSLDGIGAIGEPFSSLVNAASDNDGFLTFLYGARAAYDYSSNRLLLYNPSKPYSYIYSFVSGTVTKLVLSGESVVTSVLDYPSTIIQTSSGRLLSLYEKEDVNTLKERRTGVAVTRPLKIGNPAAYKIMDRIRNFGRIGKDSYVKYRIYGSMDGTAYAPLKSLRGKSYLFYRIAFYTNMLPKEGFSGTLIGFDYRMTNKFR